MGGTVKSRTYTLNELGESQCKFEELEGLIVIV